MDAVGQILLKEWQIVVLKLYPIRIVVDQKQAAKGGYVAITLVVSGEIRP